MQGSDQVGHSYVCKVGTKWVTLMCDPPIHLNYFDIETIILNVSFFVIMVRL